MDSKTCNACGMSKPRDAYYRQPRMADGLLARCKDCHKSAMKANRAANLERFRAFDRARAHEPQRIAAREAYARTTDGQEAQRRAKRAWGARNAHKRRAHTKLSRAVDGGSVKRQPCEKCGSPHTEGHHDDYSKPLDVRWLCTTHHAQAHVELRNQNRDPDAWKPMKGKRARVQHDPGSERLPHRLGGDGCSRRTRCPLVTDAATRRLGVADPGQPREETHHDRSTRREHAGPHDEQGAQPRAAHERTP